MDQLGIGGLLAFICLIGIGLVIGAPLTYLLLAGIGRGTAPDTARVPRGSKKVTLHLDRQRDRLEALGLHEEIMTGRRGDIQLVTFVIPESWIPDAREVDRF